MRKRYTDNNYGKVNDKILNRLKDIVGASQVSTSEEDKQKYGHDERPGIEHPPEVIVKPRSSKEVADILRLANSQQVPVTPRGGGTGLAGAAVPMYGGILLSLERMNRILEIDEQEFMAVVEPGVSLEHLHREVEKHGLFYPPDPGEEAATIGGNIATNAGGMRCVKYGVTRDYVQGLEIVLPTGKALNLGGRCIKKSTGYELIDLIIGSEGTLAVVTKAILRLLPLPPHNVILFAPFDSLRYACNTVLAILKSRIIPASLEFLQREVVEATEKYLGKKLPMHGQEVFLLIDLWGDTKEEVARECEKVGDLCMKNKAVDVLVAETKASKDRFMEFRKALHEGLVDRSVSKGVDVVVPRSKIPEYVESIKKISEKHDTTITSFGHAGDGNVHTYVLKEHLSNKEWSKKAPTIIEDLYKCGVKLGGTLSGEHGLGWVRKKYLPLATSKKERELMRGIKRLFDPNNILNPGKVFDL